MESVGSRPAFASMITETEMYHLTRMRDKWIEAGMLDNYKLITNKYKLEVKDFYFVSVEYWNKLKGKWVTIRIMK